MSAAVDFLQQWQPDSAWGLGAIDPDDAENIAWLTTSDPVAANAFLDAHGALKRNLYYQVNVPRPDLGTMRAFSGSMVVAQCIHAEIDPPKFDDLPEGTSPLQALEAWQITAGMDLTDAQRWSRKGLLRPSLVVFSGSGYQVAWLLDEPVVLWSGDPLAQDPAAVESVRSRNRRIVEIIGADPHSTDISRLLRLPGTMNWPGESKRVRYGRVDPVMAEIVDLDMSRRAPIGVFPAAVAAASAGVAREAAFFAGAPADDKMLAAISVLAAAWPAEGDDRHNTALALAGALAKQSWPAELIADFLFEVTALAGGTNDYKKRLAAANTSVSKVADGEPIRGWPWLSNKIGREATDAACVALGISTGVRASDPGFMAKVSASARVNEAPQQIDFEASLRAAIKKMANRKDAAGIVDREMLKRVVAGDFLTDSPDDSRELALVRAAKLVALHSPPGTTAQQMGTVLLSSAGILACDVPEIVGLAQEWVEQQAAGNAPLDEFVVETMGPRAGNPVAGSQHNGDVALARLGASLRFDEFANRKLLLRDDVEVVIQDRHVNRLRFEIDAKFCFKPLKDDFYDFLSDRAWLRSFHPVRDYLDALVEWDGVSRLETWLIDFAGAEDTPYVRAVSRLVLTAAVRRVRQPGCKFDEMLILESPQQGTNKSTALAALCPDRAWFTDDLPLDSDTKTLMERTAGKWIVEAGELRNMSSSDHNALKGLLSRTVDESRMAYGRENQISPRQFIVIGSTNDQQYLKDPTGDRRYWPVRITMFDVAGLLASRDQIWAEAAYLDLQHPEESYIRLSPELYAAAAAEQDKRKIDDPYRIALEDVLGNVNGMVRVQDVWKILGLHTESLPSRGETMHIATAMQSMGFVKDQRAVGGIRSVYYMRGTVEERRAVIQIAGASATGWRVTSAIAPTPPPAQPIHTVPTKPVTIRAVNN